MAAIRFQSPQDVRKLLGRAAVVPRETNASKRSLDALERQVAGPAPSEHVEQMRVVGWAVEASVRWPCLALLYAIPNAARRSYALAAYLRAEGLRAGMPDLCLPVARGGWHALYLEMKRRRGGTVSPVQAAWHRLLEAAGNKVVVCRGADAAIDAFTDYVSREG